MMSRRAAREWGNFPHQVRGTGHPWASNPMNEQHYQKGDWVVYRKQKVTTHPGPRASNVAPAPAGETYWYTVDKFWVVVDVEKNGDLVLRTRRGKQHTIRSGDRALRKASLWECLLYRSRFRAIAATPKEESVCESAAAS